MRLLTAIDKEFEQAAVIDERRIFLMRVLVLIVMVAAIFLGGCISQNTSSPSNVSRTQTPTTAPVAEDDHAAQKTVERVSILDAREAIQKGDAVFVDVRQAGQYQLGHIAGALSLPEAEIPARGSSLPKGKKIITYCS